MHYDVKVNRLPKSEVEILVSLPKEELDSASQKALKQFSLNLEIDGFRKGNVPENIVLQKIGERALLEEASNICLSLHYSLIIEQEKLDTLGRPQISVTKLAFGNPFEFKIRVALVPDFKLPDYKSIAKTQITNQEAEELKASEKEVDDILLQIRKNKAHIDWHKANGETDHHNHQELEDEKNLPKLDDEFAQQAGNFKNLDELKEKIKENIINEKKAREIEKKRAKIIEALLKTVSIDLPDILVASETEKSLAQFKDDIVRMSGTFEAYLKHTNKTEDDLRRDLLENSERRAKTQLIFNKIAEAEKIEPNKEILEQEVKNILEHYKDASEENARIYVATQLINQEVLRLLEQQ
ncbi:MAG: trigger factor [Patescibacteria group bacterium]